jgi:hypothetical protein
MIKSIWIINKKDDILYLIGSFLSSFIVIGTYYFSVHVLHFEAAVISVVVFLVMSFFFDSPHLFATYSRTYLDSTFFKQNKSLMLYSLLAIAIPPFLFISYYTVGGKVISEYFMGLFQIVALSYAYYHLSRQHWGIARFYAVKYGENETDRLADMLLFVFGMGYPYVFFAKSHLINYIPSEGLIEKNYFIWEQLIFSMFAIALFLFIIILINKNNNKYYINIVKNSLLIITISTLIFLAILKFTWSAVFEFLEYLFFSGFVLTLVGISTRIYFNFKFYSQINAIKWLFIFTVLSVHNIILHLSVPLGFIIISLTIFHNIQYLKMVHVYNKNKYLTPSAEKEHGVAAILARNFGLAIFVYFISSAIITALRSNNILYFFSIDPLSYFLAIAIFWGIAFHHYTLDAVIWRVRKTEVSKVFNL